MSNFLSVYLSKSISFPLLSLVQMVGSLSRPGHAGSSARVYGLISPGMRAGIKSYMIMVNLLDFFGNSRPDSFLKKKQRSTASASLCANGRFCGGKGGRRLLNERAVIMPSLQDRLRFSETSVCQVAQLVCHIS